MISPRNGSSLGRFLVGGVMAALALACTADAVQSTSTPNAALIPYNLASGAFTGNYVPNPNTATLIMTTGTTSGWEGVSFVTVTRIPTHFIMWAGMNSTSNDTPIPSNTGGYSGAAGTKIANLDYAENVYLEVATTDAVRIHNTDSSPRTGNMTWIW